MTSPGKGYSGCFITPPNPALKREPQKSAAPLSFNVRCHGEAMKRLVFFITMAIITACSSPSEPIRSPLSCVPRNACGCSIVVTGSSCPGGGAHFFHELGDGSPLHFNLGQGPAAATSAQAMANVFSHEPGSSWLETYHYGGGSIVIRYTPSASTCPKLAQGEQCEYFDIRATLLFSNPQGTRRHSGVGVCGC